MEYRKLGQTGTKVSVIGIGCNNFGMRIDQSASKSVVDAALDCGINFFDTADVYGERGKSEEYLGSALKGNRQDVIIASKFGAPMGDGELDKGASRRYIFKAVEASLTRLGTDYIDLYQLHLPDSDTGVEETLAALHDLVTQGKIRYLGNSNFSGWQIADADWYARSAGLNRFVTAQNQYSLMDRRVEREVLPACERFGLGMLPYFPLASGLLTGKYQRGIDAPQDSRLKAWGERGKQSLSDENFNVIEKLTAYANDHDHSLLELAMSWLVRKPVISSVIAGATKPQQVIDNASACEWKLSEEEMNEIASVSKRV
jgi:aryl-alcohol dehydrogenase-like predicted oxidoreductase